MIQEPNAISFAPERLQVVRSALQNAASVAGLMLTTEALVAEKPKEEKAGGAGGHAGHGHDF